MEKEIALVTGGVTGIGNSVALALANQGYHVVVFDVDEARGSAMERDNADVSFKRCDITSERHVRQLVSDVHSEFGRIDVLINNAGIIRRRSGEEISVLDWDDVFAVNARGAFLLCSFVSPIMKSQKSGWRPFKTI